jgi:AcrR family transcriptional regulator
VVERSGQSLRSFYQYFAGKHELLLAIFEEGIRTSADELSAAIEGVDDPLERLNRFTVEQYQRCQPTPRGKGRAATPIMEPAIIDFAQQLLTAHPKEASRAFRPIVAILEQLLTDAADAGAIRPELASRRVAGAMLGAIMFNTFGATISGTPVAGADGAEELWDVILHGMAPGPA